MMAYLARDRAVYVECVSCEVHYFAVHGISQDNAIGIPSFGLCVSILNNVILNIELPPS